MSISLFCETSGLHTAHVVQDNSCMCCRHPVYTLYMWYRKIHACAAFLLSETSSLHTVHEEFMHMHAFYIESESTNQSTAESKYGKQQRKASKEES